MACETEMYYHYYLLARSCVEAAEMGKGTFRAEMIQKAITALENLQDIGISSRVFQDLTDRIHKLLEREDKDEQARRAARNSD